MKKKPSAKDQKIIADEIHESAHRSLAMESRKRKEKCEVCAAEVAPNSTEPLCWVCRRLKISAWRDSDLQASAPE
jgi:methionyl-tRNA synthetase